MPRTSTTRAGGSEPSVAVAAVAGAGAFAAGYLLTYAVVLIVGLKQRVAGPDPTWAVRIADLGQGPSEVGAVFYSAHLVDLSLGYLSVDLVGALSEAEPALLALYAVPAVVLVVVGALLGRGAREGAAAGAKLTAGYLPLALAGRFFVSVGPQSAQPDLVTAVLIAGLLYPLVFGAIGGALSR